MNSFTLLAQAQEAAPVATPAAAPAATTAVPAAPAPQSADQEQQPSGLQAIIGSPIFMFVIIGLLFYMMLIRPQRKAQKEHANRIANLQRGDKVVTNAGIHGTIESVNDRTVKLKIAEGTIIELEKVAVTQVEKS